MRKIVLGWVLVLWSSMLHGTANAQERGVSGAPDRVGAPRDALELKLGGGYTQGFGMIAPGVGLPSVAKNGAGVSLDVDYRTDERWSLGIEAQYQELVAHQSGSTRGMVGNIGATYHVAPTRRGDPWLRLGTGYRLLWENAPSGPDTSILRHGFEIATLKIGVDVRMSEDVAIAPFIGGDLDAFIWEVPSGSTPARAYSAAQVATFVYAGLQARFDIGGSRVGGPAPRPVALTAATAPAPEPPAPAPPAPAPPPTPTPPPPPTPVAPSIAVSQDIVEQCKLQLGDVEKAPKFDYAKADLSPSDLEVLRQIAACFTTGPMKGASMTLIGRADPRGSATSNEALGRKRAKAVADYLESLGVHDDQIEQTSRGERDAKGHDEATWATDRRVDILKR